MKQWYLSSDRRWSIGLVAVLIGFHCRQVYNAPVKSPATGYLVVEGFINVGQSPTSIQLSRTTSLTDTTMVVYENNATVTIEGSAGDSFALSPGGNGTYSSGAISLNSTEPYRLRIQTSNGEQYLSAYETPNPTPPIDSVSWIRDSSGVNLYVSTHDPTNRSKYYLWDFNETWEFHSLPTSLTYTVDSFTGLLTSVVYRYPGQGIDSSLYTCWRSQSSTGILIASTEKLSNSVVNMQPLQTIPQGAQELSALFSIDVDQYALSANGYAFYQEMQANTEQLGSIFDALPSSPNGNIQCLTNPSEPVVGFVDVTTQQSQRIFIDNLELPLWGYEPNCLLSNLLNNPDSLNEDASFLIPTTVICCSSGIVRFWASKPACVDCTLTGSNVKPAFWP